MRIPMRIAYGILAALICAPGWSGQTPAAGGLTGTVTTRSGAGIPHATAHAATATAAAAARGGCGRSRHGDRCAGERCCQNLANH